MKKVVLIGLCSLMLWSCKKDRYEFTMKSIKLNSCHKSHYPSQGLSLKIVWANEPNSVLANTEPYPSTLTLPATFDVSAHPKVHLYKEPIAIQLWGDSTGFMASSTMDMKEYKIMFPIEMETKNDSVSFTVIGSWE